VWGFLLAAVAAACWLSATQRGSAGASFAIFLLAAAKIHLILWHFMELKRAPVPWRIAASVWLALVTAISLSGYVVLP
jgi:heme/copper-type cytochrome/quinol oxidase subunit 4